MSWFQLDPNSLAERAKSDGVAAPTLAQSLLRGALGFTVVSIGGFAPWVFVGRWFRQHGGEVGLYIACAITFVVLSGLLLHRLIIGSGSLSRFYKLFGIAFVAYAIAWVLGYMSLRGYAGSIVGLVAGTLAMGLIFATAFDAMHLVMPICFTLLLSTSLGYFAGWPIEHALMKAHPILARFQWGVVYGLGFGAGIGAAFYLCQSRARTLLKTGASDGI